MFPSKSIVDYMSEMNRLFPRTDDDILQSNAYSMAAQSPYNSTNNRSSSSADSTSPDSFPEICEYNPRPMFDTARPVYEHQTPIYEPQRPMSETPRVSGSSFSMRRPILGRKILPMEKASTPNNERFQMSPIMKIPDFPKSMGQDDAMFPQTPPNAGVIIEQKNYTQNISYELFPNENNALEFKTPVKTPPTMSSISNISPTLSNISPRSINRSPSYPSFTRSSSVCSSIALSSPKSSHYNQDIRQSKICSFCRKNGETPLVYMTHHVKERIGNKIIVTCPILRSYVCVTCGASGDNAHTIYDVDNSAELITHRNHRRRKERSLLAHVHVSSVCEASAGKGEFLVMARRRLGRYSIVCTPRVEDWIQLVKKRNADGTAHCVLQC